MRPAASACSAYVPGVRTRPYLPGMAVPGGAAPGDAGRAGRARRCGHARPGRAREPRPRAGATAGRGSRAYPGLPVETVSSMVSVLGLYGS